MKEINDSQSLIGLSKEQVEELLGKPGKTHKLSHSTIYFRAKNYNIKGSENCLFNNFLHIVLLQYKELLLCEVNSPYQTQKDTSLLTLFKIFY